MSQAPAKVLNTIADALGISPAELTEESMAVGIDNWDSMGTMNILLSLGTDFGLRLAPGETSKLQSVKGIMELLQEAGKLP